MKATVELEGFQELIDKMNRMGDAVRAVAKEAVEAGAQEVMKEADRKAPRPDAIDIEFVEQNAKQTVFAIGLKKAKWFLRFFEFGTQPQEVTSKTGYFVFEGDAGLVITKTIQHKGMAAQPFLGPAIKTGQERVTKLMGQVFKDAILRFTK